MIAALIIGLVAVTLMVMGYLIWKKEKISLLHDYHYDKVSKEDKKAFCALSGGGVLVMGIGMFITAVIVGITDASWSFIAFAIGFFVGSGMLIYAGSRYNR